MSQWPPAWQSTASRRHALWLATGSCVIIFMSCGSEFRARCSACRHQKMQQRDQCEVTIMAWTTPTLIEICIGLEINGYLPAEF